MNTTQKNIMTDIICNFEGLQDCLDTLLKEEERYARSLAGVRGSRTEYDKARRTCKNLKRTIRMLDGVVDCAGGTIGQRRAVG